MIMNFLEEQFMSGEIKIPNLTYEQIIAICDSAEESARKYIFSRLPKSQVIDLNITVDVEGIKPLTIYVGVDVVLSPLAKDVDVDELVNEAAEKAISAADEKVREHSCRLEM